MIAEADVAARQLSWQQKLAKRTARAETVRTLAVEGCLRRVVGLTLEAEGCEAALGARCLVDTVDGAKLDTEVVGFADERLLLMPVPVRRRLPVPMSSGGGWRRRRRTSGTCGGTSRTSSSASTSWRS